MSAPVIIPVIVAVLMLLWLTEWTTKDRSKPMAPQHWLFVALGLLGFAFQALLGMAPSPIQKVIVILLLTGALLSAFIGVRKLRRYCVGKMKADAHWCWSWQVAGYFPDAKGEYRSDGEVICKRHRLEAIQPVDPKDYPDP